jgi:hypothetical protein
LNQTVTMAPITLSAALSLFCLRTTSQAGGRLQGTDASAKDEDAAQRLLLSGGGRCSYFNDMDEASARRHAR